jgi:hypothetical protein
MLIGASIPALAALAAGPSPALAASVGYKVGAITEISARCGGQNAEVEGAVDPVRGYAYEDWIGCNGIGFARSTDGGVRFGKPIRLPGSGSLAWDPAVTVASNGVVYAAFMVMDGTKSVPVVVASFDHGRTFRQKTVLSSPRQGNWGDRDFIATGPGARVYLTWDYGPSSSNVTLDCSSIGSCAITAGEVNIVIQASSNGGKSFGPMVHVSPGFPSSGGGSAPLVVEPSGKIDVLYAGSRATGGRNDSLGVGHNFFTSSVDGGHRWTKPVELGHSSGSISSSEWWIDGAISSDAAGNLYATWDTQRRGGDVGWLSYSTDHGARWSNPIRVTADGAKGPHIVQSAGGPPGIAYVGWLAVRRPWGYAEFLRTFSITRGLLSTPRQISRRFGSPRIWPGDTFGIATVSPNRLVLSWGSAIRSTHRNSEIFAVPVSVTLPAGIARTSADGSAAGHAG